MRLQCVQNNCVARVQRVQFVLHAFNACKFASHTHARVRSRESQIESTHSFGSYVMNYVLRQMCFACESPLRSASPSERQACGTFEAWLSRIARAHDVFDYLQTLLEFMKNVCVIIIGDVYCLLLDAFFVFAYLQTNRHDSKKIQHSLIIFITCTPKFKALSWKSELMHPKIQSIVSQNSKHSHGNQSLHLILQTTYV